MIQYYEKGDREGRKVEIPKSVRLACFAVLHGIRDFDGERVESRQVDADSPFGEGTHGRPPGPESGGDGPPANEAKAPED